MSYWSNHIEEMEEIMKDNLPKPWKQKFESGEIDWDHVPVDVRLTAFEIGEPDYWGGLVDAAEHRMIDR